jgi:antitoxin component HigA of HigAB toxin-antitoxin module
MELRPLKTQQDYLAALDEIEGLFDASLVHQGLKD